MKRYSIVGLLLILAAVAVASAIIEVPIAPAKMMNMAIVSGGAPVVADFCAAQAWNTLTNFRLDFDHTTDTRTACLTSGTELGALTTATITTPAAASPGSGGNALSCGASPANIALGNSGGYFASQYGTIYFLFLLEGDNTAEHYIFDVIQTPAEERLQLYIEATGKIGVVAEGSNDGAVPRTTTVFDVDSYYNKWIQANIRWDSTRCTGGSGNCADAGEDEVCIRFRVYDGSWGEWTTWECDADADDLPAWDVEPGAGEIKIGINGGTYAQKLWIDDVEISNAKPSW